jgi:hypothetical protein
MFCKPRPGCAEAIKDLREDFEVVAVSRRPMEYLKVTRDWLARHGIVVDDVALMPVGAKIIDSQKLPLLVALESAVHLDNNGHQVEELRQGGIKAIKFTNWKRAVTDIKNAFLLSK